MNLPLKIIKFSKLLLNSTKGTALTVVIFFAAIVMISVFSYLFHQMRYIKPSIKSPSSLQALFNSRSGIYRALYKLVDSTAIDTLPTISTLDSTFGASMFGGIPDTSEINDEKPQLDGTPITYHLFENDSLGECEVSLEPAGGLCLLKSIGRYNNFERHTTATLGCRIPALPDTVVLYSSEYPLKGNEPRGTIVSKANIAKVNTSWYSQITDRYLTEITDTDTFLLDPPLIIQSRHDLSKIKPTIYGPLLIDGAHIGITWRDTGTYIIKGDFQITGEVEIEGITFVVAGEIKMLDNAILKNCNLFTQSRLFIGDFAQFEGSALAMHSITVYGKSTVSGKSSLIAGSSSSSDNTNKTSDSLKFSILLSEESIVDAVCIALSTPGSIKTDEATKITGILWAQHIVCHRGEMSGLICADRVVDCNDPEQMATSETASQMNTLGDSTGNKKDKHLQPIELTNEIPGYIEPLPEINLYSLPFFLGRLSIVAWKEE